MTIRRSSLVLVVAVVALLFGAQPRPAFACLCIAPSSPLDGAAQSDAVFSGRVTRIQTPNQSLGVSGADSDAVTFDVAQVWKGENVTPQIVHTQRAGRMCGFGFETGRAYLVYASRQKGSLNTDGCTRTALLADAAQDVAALGAPHAVTPQQQASADPPSEVFWGFVVTVGWTALMLGGWRLMRRLRH